jgi:hypothetical protein
LSILVAGVDEEFARWNVDCGLKFIEGVGLIELSVLALPDDIVLFGILLEFEERA